MGTFTTFKTKGIIKDFARIFSVDFAEANLITSIIDKDDNDFPSIIKRATKEPRLKAFIKKNTDIFYMLPTILDQPKTKSIHPCAVIVFPDVMKASEWCPVRYQQGQIVSEWGGGQMDNAGFLKDDILGIKQLDKFTDILDQIRDNGKQVPDIYNLPHDPEVYRFFGNGWNGDVFQFGSSGLIGYTKQLKPQNMEDLTAAVALYRPGPMGSGYHDIYVKCKNEGRAPEYLWGTEDITKNTFGLLIYQEQIMEICRILGGLSMREADDVRRAMGKLKLQDLMGWADKIEKGFLEKGATKEEFKEVWEATVEFTRYGFNRSHAVAYAATGYISQWLKVNYPIEYWTTALSYSGEDETLEHIAEILQANKISVRPPDINKSGIQMFSDQTESTIFWGFESIKGIGEDTANQILTERTKNGPYRNFADFFFRHNFKGSKVKKQTYEGLIACGAFDKLYGLEGREERRLLLVDRYRKYKRVKITNPTRDVYTVGKTESKWWWLLQQKKLTGLAFIDYKTLVEKNDINPIFAEARDLNTNQERGIFRSFGGYVVDIKVGRSKNGEYARLTIEHNYRLIKLLIWSDEFSEFKKQVLSSDRNLVLFTGELRYDPKFSKANQFTLKDNSQFIVL